LEDAGYDIYVCIDASTFRIGAGETALVPTGVASAFDAAWYLQLCERGSLGARGLAVRSGVIDSGFRGEWLVGLTNHNAIPLYIADAEGRAELARDDEPKWIHPAEKAICQAVLLPVPETEVREITPNALLSMPSLRGAGMLGSSGK
jgi:dUTP pyrophosphatase